MVIFEDHENDVLSKLFRACYTTDDLSEFVYARGNGNLYSKAEYVLKSTDNNVYLFMDAVPENDAIKRIYEKLKKLSRNYNDRLVIFPIVCAEYYFIKAFYKYKYLSVMDFEWNDYLSKEDYREFSFIESEEDKEFATNFEHASKLLISKVFRVCISNKNSVNSFYDNSCEDMDITCKSRMYTLQYPCRPFNKNYDKSVVSKERIVEIHRQLVLEFNEFADKYNKISDIKTKKLSYQF